MKKENRYFLTAKQTAAMQICLTGYKLRGSCSGAGGGKAREKQPDTLHV